MTDQEGEYENTRLIISYSKLFDQNRELLEGLPYKSAFEFLTGDGSKLPEDRESDERALWQKVLDADETEEDRERAMEIIEHYPFGSVDEVVSMESKQKLYCELLNTNIWFDKFDVRFVKDLINKIEEGRLVSIKQFKYIKYFVYRYREQIKDQVIYERNHDDWVYDEIEELGDDVRDGFSNMINNCKKTHDQVNPRGDNNDN